jgi:DNA-binding IclR family transcriptional regulator
MDRDLATEEKASERAGIQSVEVAARLLDALTKSPAAMSLSDLAAAAAMPMSKAHRYLVSLIRCRLVNQDPDTGRYDLGPLALGMGLTALGRIDAVRIATATLPELRDRVDETAVLAVWGEHGATVIRFEESVHPVRMNVRVGSVLPFAHSAIGQIFAAYLPETVVRDALAREFAGAPGGNRKGAFDRRRFDKIRADVRRRGLNRNVGTFIPGVSAMAAPILNNQDQIAAVIGVLGHQVSLDTSWDGPVAGALRHHASEVSARLGNRSAGVSS